MAWNTMYDKSPATKPNKLTQKALAFELDQAELKAIDAMKRCMFQMFGYWAGIWEHLNRISGWQRPNPFKDFVKLARSK